MLNQALLVVSDKFSNFAIRKDIITISTLHNLLAENSIFLTKEKKITFIPGQGLNKETINFALEKMKKHRNFINFDLTVWSIASEKASSAITHKHKEENILISDPLIVSKNEFLMDILIDDNCELMRDHQTGLHIQGILLLEASRQSYIAIYEKYLSKNTEKKPYFIFNNMKVEYNKFAFPIPAKIRAKIVDEKTNKNENKIVMHIDVIQCNSVSANLSLEMSIVDNTLISKIESKMARNAINEHMSQIINSENQNREPIYA